MDYLLLAAAQAATVWHCALSTDLTRLECAADPMAPVAAAASAATTVNGTRFPLDTSRRWTVEMWSPPSDVERVTQLARAAICYRSPACEVQLTLPAAIAATR